MRARTAEPSPPCRPLPAARPSAARLSVLVLLAAAGVLAQEPQPQPTPAPATAGVGAPAPAFRLNDHGGKAVAVGGPAAKWTVLAFYPKAATPG